LDLAARTPADRDRYVDFLRAFSISVVVLGHWLIAVVVWKGGSVEGSNALESVRGLWGATWLLQVMPLFFFVGGFSNLRSYRAVRRRGAGYAAFLHGRLVRMMRPTALFLGIGSVITITLDALNVADNVVFPASELITRPLWFLGVYMIVVALAPLMVALHERLGWQAVALLAGIAIVVDIVRFGFDITAVGYVNYPVVWLLAHQWGFLYAEGKLSPPVARWMAAGGLAAMIGLVALGPYPGSMVGLSTDEFSNMDPPTVVIMALTVWQIGLAMVLRRPISAWLAKTRPWAGVIFANSVIMTMFLWHLTAMLLGIGILYPLGFPQPDAGTAQWWALRAVWIGVLLLLLAVFVLAFGRFERKGFGFADPPPPGPDRPGAVVAVAVAVALLVLGVLGFAMGGMHQLFSTTGTELIIFRLNPFQSILHLVLGGVLLWGAVRPQHDLFFAAATGAIALLLLFVVGLVMVGDAPMNRLAVNTAGNVFHGVAALALAVAAFAGRPRQQVD
jgi:hypothetical protein